MRRSIDSTSTADLKGQALRLVQAQSAQRYSSTADQPHKHLSIPEYPGQSRRDARLLPGIAYMIWISGKDGSVNLMHASTGVEVDKRMSNIDFRRISTTDIKLSDSPRHGTMIFVSIEGVGM
jgi:hypothetical protein